jgi:hypothetical protein
MMSTICHPINMLLDPKGATTNTTHKTDDVYTSPRIINFTSTDDVPDSELLLLPVLVLVRAPFEKILLILLIRCACNHKN